MKKLILLFLVIISLAACSKNKSVLLPEATLVDKTEITDISSAYLFYNLEEKDTVELNRKNLIISTNWIFNIDKRLKLYQVIPSIKMLQKKKDSNEMHKNENARNFFSVNNTDIKNLSFIDFTKTEFIFDDGFSKFYIDDNPEEFKGIFPITVNFKKDGTITLNQTPSDRDELVDFIKEFSSASAMGRTTVLYLNFDKHLTYQEYITDLTLVKTAIGNSINLSPMQFIYDEDKLPDCGCTL
ncbi:hypothetical protein NBRC110019_30660 [Neptunitalea chrysea]|uniref:Lipoprotein n=1 Tax=Neptunitalea chrysea TaxID=1647581 RepID=A0A9W6B7J0_9FLAO|nr:hypothetical protein [Neptunitalea chrysea]GLB54025.1 hypothetical protein NBRC110019_30660 [Neptunitalea chrysea]